jgi:hypothetical protein
VGEKREGTEANLWVSLVGLEVVGVELAADAVCRRRRKPDSSELRRARVSVAWSKSFAGTQGRWHGFGLRQCGSGGGSSAAEQSLLAMAEEAGVWAAAR